jgi:hypothetical protein
VAHRRYLITKITKICVGNFSHAIKPLGWSGKIRMMKFVWWAQFLLKSFVMVEMVGKMSFIDLN